jgi:hypothetical protein
MAFPWAQEKIEQLKKYWNAGYTASEIASRMGRPFTRNGIIGKAHRLKLNGRKSPRGTFKLQGQQEENGGMSLGRYYTDNQSYNGNVLVELHDRKANAKVAVFYDLDEAHKAERLFNWAAKEQAPIRSEVNNRSD